MNLSVKLKLRTTMGKKPFPLPCNLAHNINTQKDKTTKISSTIVPIKKPLNLSDQMQARRGNFVLMIKKLHYINIIYLITLTRINTILNLRLSI